MGQPAGQTIEEGTYIGRVERAARASGDLKADREVRQADEIKDPKL